MANTNTPQNEPTTEAMTPNTEDASANKAVAQALETPQKDTLMSDAPVDQVTSPLPAVNAPSPAPVRTGTPAQGSRAASVHPDPGLTIPSEAAPHGDSTRRFLNTKVTGVLLEGMKQIAKDQPNDPLRVLGEYLIQRSKDIEGSH